MEGWWLGIAALGIGFVALGFAVLLWMDHRETARMLDDLIVALRDIGVSVRGYRPPGGSAIVYTPAQKVLSEDKLRLLSHPPKVRNAAGEFILDDWLRHYARSGTTWPDVVTTFYNRLLAVDAVKDYFPVEPRKVSRIKSHFTKAIIAVTHDGITVGDVEDLVLAHANVRNSKGEPITPAIWDIVINTLAGVLTEAKVPAAAVRELAETVEPIRRALVRSLSPPSPRVRLV